ncbi:hypothetical protein AX768_26035 [Burkholderia sp. PAMC 28687]|jgi:3-isopropylmalate/(R)-2-methylmalate dehydratase large subunit|nr:hypothetical protein AX768_26035 [Burkholderia sp. PAMC 28687]
MAISTLAGRVLFLSAEPRLIERQLAGENLTLSTAHELRDDVSTDEITPMSVLTQYDERLGRYPYVGLRVGTKCPIGVDDIKSNGFCVTVAGNRYGKGSSREHSPVAELNAGIHLVIAKSFERIYRQNADNLGLFTSTDFSLVERIQRGEPIDIDELVASRDALAAAILRSGGLLRYGATNMRHVAVTSLGARVDAVPRTLAEKTGRQRRGTDALRRRTAQWFSHHCARCRP